MVCDTWFNIRKQFDATIILSFHYSAAVLATFPKIGRFFCFNFLVTLVRKNVRPLVTKKKVLRHWFEIIADSKKFAERHFKNGGDAKSVASVETSKQNGVKDVANNDRKRKPRREKEVTVVDNSWWDLNRLEAQAGNSYRKDSIITIDLLVQTNSDQLPF